MKVAYAYTCYQDHVPASRSGPSRRSTRRSKGSKRPAWCATMLRAAVHGQVALLRDAPSLHHLRRRSLYLAKKGGRSKVLEQDRMSRCQKPRPAAVAMHGSCQCHRFSNGASSTNETSLGDRATQTQISAAFLQSQSFSFKSIANGRHGRFVYFSTKGTQLN